MLWLFFWENDFDVLWFFLYIKCMFYVECGIGKSIGYYINNSYFL